MSLIDFTRAVKGVVIGHFGFAMVLNAIVRAEVTDLSSSKNIRSNSWSTRLSRMRMKSNLISIEYSHEAPSGIAIRA
jgi:hypothetical protein